jgi:formamidopyrimidine-DNA glycosylase
MPELPEVQTVVSELNRKLKNRKIASVEVRKPKIVSIGPKTVSNIREADVKRAKEFAKLLAGQKIVSITRRAKMLIFDLSDDYLSRPAGALSSQGEGRKGKASLSMFVHLKMTGQFIFEDQAQRKETGGKYRILNKLTAPLVQLPCSYTHVIVTFTDGSTLYYNDMRQFGYLRIVKNSEVDQIKELQEYGPEPFSKEFTLQRFIAAVVKRRKSSIKQVLLDPKVVAGIGNIYSDEILFHAKVAPDRLVETLDKKELEHIYKQVRPVLKKGIEAKGSSVGDFIRTDGSFGQMGKFHYVYGRGKQPCKKCGTIIKSMKLGGRTASFCPNCQK